VLIDSEGVAYDGYVVGCDERTDLAVVKTESDSVNMIPAVFGDSDPLRTGDTVFVIGNPGGLEYAGPVTKGIVSAIGRTVGKNNDLALIQTDAAINPGNSGGALVNQYGQVIGITTSKIVSTSYEGMGFAIPMSSAQSIANDLMRYGKVQNRVRLGINYSVVSPVIAAFYDFPQGLEITGLASDGVFARFDVQLGDIIVSIGGEAVRDAGMLYQVLEDYKPGDRVQVEIYRPETNQRFTVVVTLLSEE
jgi:serine protease Do